MLSPQSSAGNAREEEGLSAMRKVVGSWGEAGGFGKEFGNSNQQDCNTRSTEAPQTITRATASNMYSICKRLMSRA